MVYIKAVDVSKRYIVRRNKVHVINKLSFEAGPKEKLAILGRNGAGKSTLMRLISGQERPTSGRFDIQGNISWPMGASGNLSENLTGYENIHFIADLFNIRGPYRKNFMDFVVDFSGLPHDRLRIPIRVYSSGMRAKLAISLSYAIKFDYYLADEVLAVGDANFSTKCLDYLKSIEDEVGLIFVSHNEAQVKDFCDRCILLDNGTKVYDGSLEGGFEVYNQLPS